MLYATRTTFSLVRVFFVFCFLVRVRIDGMAIYIGSYDSILFILKTNYINVISLKRLTHSLKTSFSSFRAKTLLISFNRAFLPCSPFFGAGDDNIKHCWLDKQYKFFSTTHSQRERTFLSSSQFHCSQWRCLPHVFLKSLMNITWNVHFFQKIFQAFS